MAKNPYLYSALRGQDNWAQRRNDKAMNLAIQEKRVAREEQKAQTALKAEESINKYFDDIANMEVLEQDQERINEVESQARLNVVKGIAASNGDLTKYLSSGGVSDMHDYKNSIMKSQEVKQASSNKAMLQNYLQAKSKGLFVHDVDVDIPMTNEDGTPRLNANGEQEFEKRKMSFEDQMSLFRNGDISSLNFNGAEKPVKMNPFTFMQRPKDPSKPFSKDNIVTYSNVKFQAMEQGASEEYADRLASEYVDTVKAGGDSWKWGNKSEEDRILKQAQIRKANYRPSQKKGVTILNQRGPDLMAKVKSGKVTETPMLPQEREFFMKGMGLNFDPETNTYKPSYTIAGVDPHTGDNYNLQNALSVNVTDRYVTKNGEIYALADVAYDADNPQANNPHDETLGVNTLSNKEARHNWRFDNAESFGFQNMDGDDIVYGQVLVPVTNKFKSGIYNDSVNKMLNIKSSQEGSYGSADHDDINRANQEQIINEAARHGVSPEVYIAAMQQNANR